jgi:hypothetical protein
MWASSPAIPLLCNDPLVACFSSGAHLSRARNTVPLVTEAVERDALKLLNDSDWAHTVKPGLQDRRTP